jgi:acyl-CoA synthetase (NDP forming)
LIAVSYWRRLARRTRQKLRSVKVAPLDPPAPRLRKDAAISASLPTRRALYSRQDLRRLIAPESIAIVGASIRPGSFGERLAFNLAGFEGRTFLVNPRYDRMGEATCYPNLSALPATPDCVVVAAAATEVETIVAEAVRLGVGGIVIFASGFSETGDPEKTALQDRVVALVQGTPTRLIGPNCIGIFNHALKAQMSFTVIAAPEILGRPAIGIVSQSGALGTALSQAMEHGVRISHTLTAGNSGDVDVADLVGYLAEDDGCDAIAFMFEGLADPERLLEAGRRAWANDKPLIVYKMATGTAGAAAALSHTGALAGSNATYDAAFDKVGIIRVDAIEDLVETAAFFAKAPRRPLADGAAILSVSGGAGIIAADKAEAHGVPLPAFSEETRATLGKIIPDFGSTQNPCDMTAETLKKPEMLRACADAVLAETSVGALIYPHPFARDGATERMAILAEAAKVKGKVFCTVWVTGWLEGPGALEAETNPDVVLFRSMDRCFAALAAWRDRAARRAAETPFTPLIAAHVRDRTRSLLDACTDVVVGEAQAKVLLDAYGVPIVQERLATTLDEALNACAALGFPVVMKVESPDIPHKTEAGMVFLDLRTVEAATAAYRTILERAAAMSPPPRLNGVVVQQMIEPGLELVIGGRCDPAFGPLVVVGFGGTLVELLRDTVVALAPVSAADAKVMLHRLAGYPLLLGYRNSPPVDIAALCEVIARASEFLSDHRDGVGELDINPLIANARGLTAVDALIIRSVG